MNDPKSERTSQSRTTSVDFLQRKTVINYISGLGAGLVSTTIGYPLDVARVRYLFGSNTKNLSNGMAFAFLYSIGKSGLVWPLQKDMHEKIERHFPGKVGTILSGAFGNVVPGVIFNPCNVIKVRYMESSDKTTLRQILQHIRTQEGFGVFKKGIVATVLRDSIWGMLYFSTFSHLKTTLYPVKKNQRAEIMSTMTASAVAASTSTFLTSFLDAARLFQQKSVDARTKNYYSFWSGLKMAFIPSQRNFLSILTGVGRVTITTVFGHLTFLAITSTLTSKS